MAWRLAKEYRKLNAQTVFYEYLMPRTEDLLHGSKNNKLMSALDLSPATIKSQSMTLILRKRLL